MIRACRNLARLLAIARTLARHDALFPLELLGLGPLVPAIARLVSRRDVPGRPGETVLAPGYVAVPGGKGANQALAAARAGAATHIVGCIGRDGYAAAALATMRVEQKTGGQAQLDG